MSGNLGAACIAVVNDIMRVLGDEAPEHLTRLPGVVAEIKSQRDLLRDDAIPEAAQIMNGMRDELAWWKDAANFGARLAQHHAPGDEADELSALVRRANLYQGRGLVKDRRTGGDENDGDAQ